MIINERWSDRIALDAPTAIGRKELTMNAALGGKIAGRWECNAVSMSMFRVHHSEYPEIEAEGKTPAEACVRLIGLLVQAVDFASDAWRRQPLGLALADARAYGRRSARVRGPSLYYCLISRCKPTRAAGSRSERRNLQQGHCNGTFSRPVGGRRPDLIRRDRRIPSRSAMGRASPSGEVGSGSPKAARSCPVASAG